MKRTFKLLITMLILALFCMGCATLLEQGISIPANPTNIALLAPPTPTFSPTLMAPISSNQPFKITGSFKSTSELGGEYSDNILFAERQVFLVDMNGFITRNKEWEIPVDSQVIGHVQYNPQDASGKYTLFLPQIPQGNLNDLDNNDQQNLGVQVFAIDYEPNITGDPFMVGNDGLKGWPESMASIDVTADDANEVVGGKLIVYAPGNQESFPSDFGTDGRLFSNDDPAIAIPAGYSIVDLDTHPFTISQPAEAVLPLIEAADAGPKDYSKETYTQAFDHLLNFLRTEYAFNNIPGKQPDWDNLSAELRPRVEQAEKDKDANSFYAVLRDFTYAFKDGHAGLDGGDFAGEDFRTNYSGSLGFTVRVLDNNQVIANSVLSGMPAEAAGMKTGAVIKNFNEKPVLEVIKSQPLFFGNQSSDISKLYNQAIVLTRTKPGGQAQISFTNPDGQTKSTTLTAVPEVDSLLRELGYNVSNALLPVELNILTLNGIDIGYIKINTYADDLNLILRLFERGLKKFKEQKITGIIIDLRENGGGVPLGLAGFLTRQNIYLGKLEYYDKVQGKFTSNGELDKITPNDPLYQFDKIAVMVGLNCASACELEAYAMGKLPGAAIVGQYPSGGIEAEVSKGQVKMPEGIGMQFPTGRMVNQDGSLFLEGVGVQPTIKVPINAENVLSTQDVILQKALETIAK